MIKLKVGTPLVTYTRKTFLIGFIVAASGIKELAHSLLTRGEHAFKYFLTYKMPQDHLELLFACIRGKNGFKVKMK